MGKREQSRSVGSDPVKSRVAEGKLADKSDYQTQAQGENGMDPDYNRQVKMGLGKKERQSDSE
jgi:hypothetical protein